MQLQGIKSERIEVHVPDSEVILAAIKLLEADSGLRMADDSIDEGQVVRAYEGHGGSHSWIEHKVLREATPEDASSLAAMKRLYALSRKLQATQHG